MSLLITHAREHMRISVTSHRINGTINLYSEEGETVPPELRTSLLSVDIPSGDELRVRLLDYYLEWGKRYRNGTGKFFLRGAMGCSNYAIPPSAKKL